MSDSDRDLRIGFGAVGLCVAIALLIAIIASL